MSSPSAPGLSVETDRQSQIAIFGWALRRAALGVLILAVAVALGAWLFNASIESEDPASHSEYAVPQN